MIGGGGGGQEKADFATLEKLHPLANNMCETYDRLPFVGPLSRGIRDNIAQHGTRSPNLQLPSPQLSDWAGMAVGAGAVLI